jgi:hypothetical protein
LWFVLKSILVGPHLKTCLIIIIWKVKRAFENFTKLVISVLVLIWCYSISVLILSSIMIPREKTFRRDGKIDLNCTYAQNIFALHVNLWGYLISMYHSDVSCMRCVISTSLWCTPRWCKKVIRILVYILMGCQWPWCFPMPNERKILERGATRNAWHSNTFFQNLVPTWCVTILWNCGTFLKMDLMGLWHIKLEPNFGKKMFGYLAFLLKKWLCEEKYQRTKRENVIPKFWINDTCPPN